MMSFLTYITGFFMNFELLPILTDKHNDELFNMKLRENLLLNFELLPILTDYAN